MHRTCRFPCNENATVAPRAIHRCRKYIKAHYCWYHTSQLNLLHSSHPLSTQFPVFYSKQFTWNSAIFISVVVVLRTISPSHTSLLGPANTWTCLHTNCNGRSLFIHHVQQQQPFGLFCFQHLQRNRPPGHQPSSKSPHHV